MKSSTIVASVFLGLVAAQAPTTLPQCGQTCINNMLGQAGDLGCGATDAACLCSNADFSYGVRDCSNEACSSSDASDTINFGVDYCSSAGVVVPTASATSGATASSTGEATSSGAASSSAITTSDVLTTFTSDGATLTATAQTTLFTVIGGGAAGSASSAASSLGSSASSVAAGASSTAASLSSAASSAGSAASSAAASASSAVSSAKSSVKSAASSAASSVTGSSSSAAFAPRQTAAPMGIMAVAGLAAYLL